MMSTSAASTEPSVDSNVEENLSAPLWKYVTKDIVVDVDGVARAGGGNAKGLGYAINTSEELTFVKEIASTTGVILDPVYSGKATYGLLKDFAENPKKWEGRKILFIHTGGLLGLFDKVEQIAPSLGKYSRMDVCDSVPRKDGIGKMF